MSGYTFDFLNKLNSGSRASLLGGGLPGSVPLKDLGNTDNPQGGLRVGGLQGGGAGPNSSSGMEGGNARGMDRNVLRNAFGNSAIDFTGYRDREKLLNIISQGCAANPTLCQDITAEQIAEIIDISPLSLSNPSNFTATFGGPLGLANGKGSLCGQFRAATSLGDPRVSLIGGGRAPDQWYGKTPNPLAGKRVNGVKVGDSLKTTNISPDNVINSIGYANGLPGIPPTPSLRYIYQKGGSSYSGNPKFVADSSDFVRFKKLKAKTKTYNNKSFGGSVPQDAYSARARARG